jgi:ferric-dicitrate binding protein FerR (iron transport regulator)
MKKTGHNAINKVNPEKFTAWKDGRLMLIDDPMAVVVKKLERWYNVEVEIINKELESYVFRGTFQDDSLEDVCKYLTMTSPIGYHIEERKMLDDGTLLKTKVLFYNDNN